MVGIDDVNELFFLSIFCSRFIEKLDPSTKKQLNLLLAKTNSASYSKLPKPIVSTVPLALIRKSMLKTNDETATAVIIESPIRSPSPSKTSPTKIPSKLSPIKSNYELSTTPTIHQSRLSPSKSNYDFSLTKSKVSPSKSVSSFSSDVPMDKISIPLTSPIKIEEITESPMEIDRNYATDSDVFMDVQSNSVNFDSEDEEIILNVSNVIKSSTSSTPRVIKKEVEELELTNELPHKIRFFHESSNVKAIAIANTMNNSPMKRSTPLACSSPSISSRIKSLGLAAGTPLRAAIYRNSNNPEILDQSKFNYYNSSSLLNELIEEFCNTRDEECFNKILSLTSIRTGDFDGLTSNLVHKLFISSIGNIKFGLNLKLLTNFLNNESFLLSSSGREVIEILEEQFLKNPENIETFKTIAKSNLITILIENCIEMCCERLSEFKLILLEEFIRNFIGTNLKEILIKSITPLILVTSFDP